LETGKNHSRGGGGHVKGEEKKNRDTGGDFIKRTDKSAIPNEKITSHKSPLVERKK